jgi:hypothetical protein
MDGFGEPHSSRKVAGSSDAMAVYVERENGPATIGQGGGGCTEATSGVEYRARGYSA